MPSFVAAVAAAAAAAAAVAAAAWLCLLLPSALFLWCCTAAVCYKACLHDMVDRLMINAARCGAQLSLSGGVLAGAARDLATPRMVGSQGGLAPGGRIGGGGRDGGVGSAARLPLPLCREEYALLIAGQTPGVTDQDLR
jgi:hypothetical protein